MRILINDTYGIGADQYSFQILKIKKRRRHGCQVDEYIPIKWYTSVESLIEGFVEFQIRMSNTETLAELLQFKKELITELHERLPAEFKVVA